MGCGKVENVEHNHDHNCICEVVRVIKRVQDANTNNDDCVECSNDCFTAPLGTVSPGRANVNTRAFILFDKHGNPFKTFYKHSPSGAQCIKESIFFRVQSIFDCCATLQVLEPTKVVGGKVETVDVFNQSGKLDLSKLCEITGFRRTETCITVDLDCFCAIQCFLDTFVDLCPE